MSETPAGEVPDLMSIMSIDPPDFVGTVTSAQVEGDRLHVNFEYGPAGRTGYLHGTSIALSHLGNVKVQPGNLMMMWGDPIKPRGIAVNTQVAFYSDGLKQSREAEPVRRPRRWAGRRDGRGF